MNHVSRRPSRIPWKIFTRLVLAQAGVILALFLISGIAVRSYFRSHLSVTIANSELDRILGLFDTSLALFLSAVALTLYFFALSFAKRLIFPLGRMVIKTRSLLNPEFSLQKGEVDDRLEAFDQESYGEWSDLESSIEDIRRDLKKKTESLTVEREEQAILMSVISDAILAVDPEGGPLFYNSRFALLFGGQGRDWNLTAKKGKRLWEIFRNPEILEAYQAALKEGKPSSVQVFPIDSGESGKKFFSVSIAPLRKGRDFIYGAVGIFHDVTELKRAEQMRIDFVANVSHELRTPLTAIKGYVDTLIHDHQNHKPFTPEFLEIIARNTTRLMNLMNDLLDLSSLESTEVIQKSRLNTQELTHRIFQQLQSSIDIKKQTLSAEFKTATVFADHRRIEQVLINLLVNANKYTQEEGKISVIWKPSPDEKEVLLLVQDTGPGIPLEHQPRLFERFYRIDKARSREQGGTGLGLAIVKHIMQRHGGSVSLESTFGQGTTFICRFPVN